MELRERLLAVPKADLHLHLRGAVPPALMAEQIRRWGVQQAVERAPERLRRLWEQQPNLQRLLAGDLSDAALAGLFSYRDFDNFLATFHFTGFFFRTAEDFQALVTGVLDALAAQNIVYAELTVSAREYLAQGVDLAGLPIPQHPRVRVQWIVDLVRNYGVPAADELLGRIVDEHWNVVGITIGGSEHRYPPELFRDVYAKAAAHGLRRSVHAGEALGAPSVWTALLELGAERIGHGVRAIEDPALIGYLAERRVPLEVCPTSNLRTGLYPSYAAHPVHALCAAGVPISVNTDDPTFFGTTLVDEYLALHAAGLAEGTLREIVANAFRHAFLPEDEKSRYLAAFEAAWPA